MEVAALVLSIIAIASCSCIYVSIICGSLAMIFALLSKGGATSMSSMAMTSFWIAFAAVVITLIIYIGSFAAMLHEYGSIEGILKEYQNLTGIDYNELLQQMIPQNNISIFLTIQFTTIMASASHIYNGLKCIPMCSLPRLIRCSVCDSINQPPKTAVYGTNGWSTNDLIKCPCSSANVALVPPHPGQ